jgi:fucose permease
MKLRTLPIFLVFFIMGFGNAKGTLVGNELSGLLVIAIVFVARIPALVGRVGNKSAELSFIIPLVIFVFIAVLALSSLKKPAVNIPS